MPSDPSPLFDRLSVIGPGLIGSSVLRRAKERKTLARTLITMDRSPAVLARVRELDLADRVTASLEEAAQADCVLICVPTGAVSEVASALAPHMQPGSILSDVASVRGRLGAEIPALLPDTIAYVPAHPMAGTEYSGPDAGFATLFEDRWCLLTPAEGTDERAVETVQAFWQRCGARTRLLNETYHDQVCAIVSHLPHLLAFSMCSTADELSSELRADVLEYAASGFRDFTRIAASDPIMWRDIFLANKEILLKTLDRFTAEAQKMAEVIRQDDGAAIVERVERGRAIRRSLIENRQA